MVERILNVSAYRFVSINDAASLRDRLAERAAAGRLKGTILIAEEGINLFLAGAADALRGFLNFLREDPRFAGLDAKESWSREVPFRKLLVKVKREIIRMNQPAIRPDNAQRAPALSAHTLQRWLDEGHDDRGREVVMLDTRNAFELDHGRFRNAIDWKLRSFGDFPQALQNHRDDLRGKTVVSYCTGGIRCEKAALAMQAAGLESVWQLDGGILRYFELTDARHFEGTCFVFDERCAVDTALAEEKS